MTEPPPRTPLPSREDVLRFIRESPIPVGKREIARAFRLKGDARGALKALLRELEAEGALERSRGRRLAPPAALPETAVVVVADVDADGEVLARPASWPHDDPPPVVRMQPERRGRPALVIGDRVLAQLRRQSDGTYDGRTLRRLETDSDARVLGVLEDTPEGPRLRPADRRRRDDLVVLPNNAAGATHGELVLAEVLPATRLGLRQARVVERLGTAAAPRAASLIAIHANDIPTAFPAAALDEAERARPVGPEGRTDLRGLPLVTIDGADARDFDDAVWAEPETGPGGGWHLVVAIADVAHYVRPGRPLDRAAFQRGNSCYFPDRVVPMLPEALSNGLCSLRPGEDRACIAVHLHVGPDGELRDHRFVRGLMRSAARLTYEQVQAARDGGTDEAAGPLLDPVIRPLYGAWEALARARGRRGTLDLDLPERQVILDGEGRVQAIRPRVRLDSHRLIEEFMICANVAAAQALEARGAPCLYRVHDQPSADKLEALRAVLEGLGYGVPRGVLHAEDFTRILRKAAGRPEADLLAEMILRSQAQAAYSPDNIGHFGLSLRRYAHFTSPIRRYADLIVHRSLIRACGLGGDGLDGDGLDGDGAGRLEAIGEHVSLTERRAAAAERDAVDRYTASFLAERVGGEFAARITGVTRFGLFVTLAGSGAGGFVPAGTLPDDTYEHDRDGHALVGRRWGRVFRLGAEVRARLIGADPVAGSTVLALLEPDGADLPWLAAALGRRRAAPGKRPERRG